MRYTNQDSITFADKSGNNFTMKDFREIPEYDLAFIVENAPPDTLADEVATRQNVFGNGAEMLAYTIAEKNAEKYIEGGYNFSEVRNLEIPVVDNVLL